MDQETALPLSKVEKSLAADLDAADPPAALASPSPISATKTRRPFIYDTLLMSLCFALGMGSMFLSVSVVSLVVAEQVRPGLALVPPALQKLMATATAYPGARHKDRRGFTVAARVGSMGYLVAMSAVLRMPATHLQTSKVSCRSWTGRGRLRWKSSFCGRKAHHTR